ncbi:unnamed protein product [Phytomonas sp. Hart1]|nr:unnamed protein product [Phytomonas sp. Hart1]|eukprot:CCW67063.1 unnamed protein product [Phytomonas sp. isolate Hart1]
MESVATQDASRRPSDENDIKIIADTNDYHESFGYGYQVKNKSGIFSSAVRAGEISKSQVQSVGEQGRLCCLRDEQPASKIGANRQWKQSCKKVLDLREPTDPSRRSLQETLHTTHPSFGEQAVPRKRDIELPQETMNCFKSLERSTTLDFSPDSNVCGPENFPKATLTLSLSSPEVLKKCDAFHDVNNAGAPPGTFSAEVRSPRTAPTNIPAYSSDVRCRLTRSPRIQPPLQDDPAFIRQPSPTKRDRYHNMEVNASFGSSSPLRGLAQSPDVFPQIGPSQRGGDDIHKKQSRRSSSKWRLSHSEYVVDAKLEQQLYVLLGDDNKPVSRPEIQRWVLINKSKDTTFTAEYTFEDPEDVLILSGAVVVPNGHYLVTVPSGEWRLVAEGPPTHASIIVRTGRCASYSKPETLISGGLVRGTQNTVAVTDQLMLALMKELRLLSDVLHERRPRVLAGLCTRHGVDYVDLSFPPLTASLGHRVDSPGQVPLMVRWAPVGVRPTVRARPTALRVGPLGDHSVASALRTLAEAPWSLQRSFFNPTNEDEAVGVYGVWLAQRGLWGLVSVDGYFPCVQDARTGRLTAYGCTSAPVYDLWVAICEKALAKVAGSYSALRVLAAAHVISSFTGGPAEVWDWWKKDRIRAFLEMDAVINTNARGFGIVLLTTADVALSTSVISPIGRKGTEVHVPGKAPTEVTDVDIRNKSSDLDEILHFFQRTGLEPGTTYQVLCVAEDAKGGLKVLMRDWRKRPRHAAPSTEPTLCLSGCKRGSLSEDVEQFEADAMSESDSFCIWLTFEDEVLKFCQRCDVCFDCRCFHDVRVVVPFQGRPIATPLFFSVCAYCQPRMTILRDYGSAFTNH